MNILVASDTHGRYERLAEAIRRARPDVLLFLGDGLRDLRIPETEGLEVRAVCGNCDWYTGNPVPEARLEVIGGVRIFLTHGHRYGVKWGLEKAVAAALQNGADVLLYGHTHIPFEKTLPRGHALEDGSVLQRPLLVVCPGSLGEPPDGRPAFATLTVRPSGVLAGFGTL